MSVFQSKWRDWAPETPKTLTDKTDKRASVSNVSACLEPFPENQTLKREGGCPRKAPSVLTDKTDKSLSQGFSLTGDKADGSRLVTLLRVPEGCPEEWCDGIARLLSMPPPGSYGADTWATLRDDAADLFWRWSGEAARLGWPTLAIWGVHRTRPQIRADCLGLVAILRGRRITRLTAGVADIDGLRFYKPKPAADSVPLWDLK